MHPLRHRGDHIEFVPQSVELALGCFIKDQVIQGSVVAKVARLIVQTGAEQTSDIAVGLFFFGIHERAAAFLDVKSVRKECGKPSKCRLILGT